MDEDDNEGNDEKPCAAKLSRKIGEKLRRDRLNSLITQLAEEIPIIRYAHKRLDKSTILRLTVSYMELHHGLKRKQLCNIGGRVTGSCLLDWLKKMTDEALMIMNQSGTILYISPKITDHIGFYQVLYLIAWLHEEGIIDYNTAGIFALADTDMLGHKIDQFIHRNDLHPLMSLFSSEDTNQSSMSYATFKPSLTKNGFAQMENWHDEHSLYIRLLKANRRKRTAADAREYETFNIHCRYEKTSNSSNKAVDSAQRWMVTLLKPVCKEPVREVEVQISQFIRNNEWASMHSLDGKILAQDHRCALFHGYMPSESIGKTPYVLIHEEDMGMIALSHRNIMTDHETSTVFRMNTAMNETLYIQSHSIIVKESWTKTPKCIVSVNTILDVEKGMRLLDIQKEATKELLEDSELMQEQQVVKATSENGSSELNKTCDSKSVDNISSNENNSGRSLTEIYEEKAKFYQYLYSSQDDHSETSSRPVDAEKRSFECVESDMSGSESYASGFSDSSVSEQYEDKRSPSSQKNPVLKSLLNSKKRVLTLNEICESDDKGKTESLPLLKGILEGRVKMNESSYLSLPRQRKPSNTSLSSDSYCELSNKISCDEEEHFEHYQEPEYCFKATEDGGSCSSGIYSALNLGSEASSQGIQSPTFGSSESCTDSTWAGAMVYNKFTKQLESKHALIKRTISSQKNTLEILREQIQKSHNNVQLGMEEQNIHDSLLERLINAETQVEVQGQLLGELEKDIQIQKHSALSS